MINFESQTENPKARLFKKKTKAKKHRFIRLSECMTVWFTGFR